MNQLTFFNGDEEVTFDNLLNKLRLKINEMDLDAKVEAINKVKEELRKVSPFTEPVDVVK